MNESEVGFSLRPHLGTSVWRKLLGSLAWILQSSSRVKTSTDPKHEEGKTCPGGRYV